MAAVGKGITIVTCGEKDADWLVGNMAEQTDGVLTGDLFYVLDLKQFSPKILQWQLGTSKIGSIHRHRRWSWPRRALLM